MYLKKYENKYMMIFYEIDNIFISFQVEIFRIENYIYFHSFGSYMELIKWVNKFVSCPLKHILKSLIFFFESIKIIKLILYILHYLRRKKVSILINVTNYSLNRKTYFFLIIMDVLVS